jgi:hypothetical protein
MFLDRDDSKIWPNGNCVDDSVATVAYYRIESHVSHVGRLFYGINLFVDDAALPLSEELKRVLNVRLFPQFSSDLVNSQWKVVLYSIDVGGMHIDCDRLDRTTLLRTRSLEKAC